MGSKLSKCLSRWRRGFGRAAVFLIAAMAIFACACGCGRSGHVAGSDSDKAADVEVLNAALAQELTTLDAYRRGLPLLRGRALAIGRQLRGQDQAHVDALTKAIRGLGGETDAEASELEEPGPRSQAEALALVYEEENAALAQTSDAPAHLQTSAPSTLATALAASHAQHLVLLRQALGASQLASVPQPFDTGDIPPPTVDRPGASK